MTAEAAVEAAAGARRTRQLSQEGLGAAEAAAVLAALELKQASAPAAWRLLACDMALVAQAPFGPRWPDLAISSPDAGPGCGPSSPAP